MPRGIYERNEAHKKAAKAAWRKRRKFSKSGYRIQKEIRTCFECEETFVCSVTSSQKFVNLEHYKRWVKKNRSFPKSAYIGRCAWNKDLTKEIDPRLAKCGRRGKDHPMYGRIGPLNPFFGKNHTEEAKQKDRERFLGKKLPEHSKRMKILWQTPEYVAKQMLAKGCCPNKAENLLKNILNTFYPGEFKYVGDGQFILAGKCPDFINVNGKKQIIELFGDYWHQDEDPQERINLFAQYGFQTLVVWEHELKKISSLVEKINSIFCCIKGE